MSAPGPPHDPSDHDIDEEEGAPFDDPASRTRMAWLRTLLIVGVLSLLLVRAAYVQGEGWLSLAWLAPSVIVIAVGLSRMHALALRGPAGADRRLGFVAWTTVGVVGIAASGMVLAWT